MLGTDCRRRDRVGVRVATDQVQGLPTLHCSLEGYRRHDSDDRGRRLPSSRQAVRSCVQEVRQALPERRVGRQLLRVGTPAFTAGVQQLGNGSAMRVSPVAWAYQTESAVLEQARASAEVTHSHPEGVKGAQATALAIFLARRGSAREEIRDEITRTFSYDLSRTVDAVRPELPLRCFLPGHRSRSVDRFPRFGGLRGCHPQRDLPRR